MDRVLLEDHFLLWLCQWLYRIRIHVRLHRLALGRKHNGFEGTNRRRIGLLYRWSRRNKGTHRCWVF